LLEKENYLFKNIKITEISKNQSSINLEDLSNLDLNDMNEAIYISTTIKSLREEKKRILAEIELLGTEFYKNLAEK
jgi:hypothetical protein